MSDASLTMSLSEEYSESITLEEDHTHIMPRLDYEDFHRVLLSVKGIEVEDNEDFKDVFEDNYEMLNSVFVNECTNMLQHYDDDDIVDAYIHILPDVYTKIYDMVMDNIKTNQM